MEYEEFSCKDCQKPFVFLPVEGNLQIVKRQRCMCGTDQVIELPADTILCGFEGGSAHLYTPKPRLSEALSPKR